MTPGGMWTPERVGGVLPVCLRHWNRSLPAVAWKCICGIHEQAGWLRGWMAKWVDGEMDVEASESSLIWLVVWGSLYSYSSSGFHCSILSQFYSAQFSGFLYVLSGKSCFCYFYETYSFPRKCSISVTVIERSEWAPGGKLTKHENRLNVTSHVRSLGFYSSYWFIK